jgi:polar amino acid transport system substrate-binding protein
VVPTPVRSLPSAGGVRKDGDGRFFKFVNEWAVRSRADGTVKRVMIDAIVKNGLDPQQLPAEFSF